jgi:peroxiredoxin
MTKTMKYMHDNDTNISYNHTCFFKTLSDTLHPFLFHNHTIYGNGFKSEMIYTGSELYTLNHADSTCTRTDKSLWPQQIKNRCRQTTFYRPLVSERKNPLSIWKNQANDPYQFNMLPDTVLNGTSCFVISAYQYPREDTAEMISTLRHSYIFRISQRDFLPLQMEEVFDLLFNKDTLYQIEKLELHKLDTILPADDTFFTSDAIPSYYRIEDYIPYEIPPLLPDGTEAPDWTLPTTDETNLHLKDLRGNLVLLDFFYRSCYPCIKAIPGLNNLDRKYRHRGLIIIGVNPVDQADTGLKSFLQSMDISYPVVLKAREVAETYNVHVYPSLYLIDQEGKIIFTQTGYSEENEQQLEKMINDYLQNK